MDIYKKTFAAISGILFIVITALFFIVSVTPLYIIAYIFALLGIIGLWSSAMFVLKNASAYPWVAAIPIAAIKYLCLELVLSAVFVILEQLGLYSLPTAFFIIAHILILAIFAIRIIMLNAGKKEIERVEGTVKQSTFDWKLLIADIQALAERSPELKSLLDAIKYSDPATPPELAEYDEKIRDGITALEKAVDVGNGTLISELSITLQRQIKDRNNRAKLLK